MKKSFQQLRVKDVMSRQVVSIGPDDTLSEAMDLIVENRVAALPVVDARGHCVGMISTSDLIDLTSELDHESHEVGRVEENSTSWLMSLLSSAFGAETVASQMSDQVELIGPEESLPVAAATMLRCRVHRLPVVDQQKHLLGIISTMDILSVVADGEVSG